MNKCSTSRTHGKSPSVTAPQNLVMKCKCIQLSTSKTKGWHMKKWHYMIFGKFLSLFQILSKVIQFLTNTPSMFHTFLTLHGWYSDFDNIISFFWGIVCEGIWEQFHLEQVSLKLTMQLKMSLNSWDPFPYFPSAGFTSMPHCNPRW